MLIKKEPSIWSDTTAGNKKCLKCISAGGNMSDCNLCSSASICSKCATKFLDDDGKGCIDACSSSTSCIIDFSK